MSRSRNFLYLCCLFLFLFNTGTPVQAQIDPPTDDCNPIFNPDEEPPPLPPHCIPIDGGLAFLLVAGIGYGVVKNRSNQKKEQNETGLS